MSEEILGSVSVKDIAKKLNKAYKNNVLATSDLIPECERFSMGSLSADYATYGGLPLGNLIVFSGESQSGKSVFAARCMAEYQKSHPDKICIYADAEGNLPAQLSWFEEITGLDTSPERFMRYDCAGKAAEDIFDDLWMLQRADDIGMIILDSAPALISKIDLEKPISEDNGMRASVAKTLGKFCKFMLVGLAKAGNPMIIINHVRVTGKTHQGAKIYEEPCGFALDYYPAMKIRFAPRKFTKGENLEVSFSQRDNTIDGFCVIFSVTKNRLGLTDRTGAKVIFRTKATDEFDVGVDTLTDLIEIITKYDIAPKLNNTTRRLVNPLTGETLYDKETKKPLELAGRPKLIAYLKSHPEFTKEYEKMVSAYLNRTKKKISLIDEEDLAKILEVENAIQEENNKKRKKRENTVVEPAPETEGDPEFEEVEMP